MTKQIQALWQFLASVKLALITLFILAATSIVGTVIQQRKAPSYYVEEYGETLAGLLQTLDITNMYSSWWFVALLTLFAVNLVVCSIERLPVAWRLVVRDSLQTDSAQLEKMSSRHRAETGLPAGEAADRMGQLLAGAGWKRARRLDRDGSTLLFAQRGAWTRLGVYVVHLSILVILAGVMIGSIFGYKAYVFLPEGRSTSNVFLQKGSEPVPLGFELYYDQFDTVLYPNGMIREYRSALTVYDPERKTPYEKTTVVNDPLSYGGINFYIADNFPLEEFFIVVRSLSTGREQAFRMPSERQVEWPEAGVTFSIEELRLDQDNAVRQASIRFADDADAEPSVFWMNNKSTVNIQGLGGDFTFSFRQLYSTLFLANKDPGIGLVYFGFCMMVVGLCISFFLSHQRIWVYITAQGKQGSRILVSGSGNKNQPAFERRFQALVDQIQLDAPKAKTRSNPAEIRRPVKKAV